MGGITLSWDASIVDRDGNEIIDVGNYTFNVSPMYIKAMGITLGSLHNKPVYEVLHVIRSGIDNMNCDPEVYRALNPNNGWGKYEGALQFLNAIYKACYENKGLYLKVY